MKQRASAGRILQAAGILVTVVLLAVIGALQSRWIAQLSDAGLERDRISLQMSTKGIQYDINREVSRAYSVFRLDPGSPPETWGRQTSAAFATWRQTAQFPLLVHRLLLVQPAGDGALRMSVYDGGTEAYLPIVWPAELGSLRKPLELPLRGFEAFGVRTFTGVALAAAPVLVVPLQPTPFSELSETEGWLLIELDQRELLTNVLPEAIRDNVEQPGQFDYQVTGDAHPSDIIYQSNPASGFSNPDASFSLIELQRQYLFSAKSGNGRALRFPIGDNPEEARLVSRPTRWHSVRVQLPGVPPAALNEGGVWQLQIRHRAGSLQAAAARLRRGNLLLSFAVLAVAAGNLAVLALVARRAHRLAEAKLEFAAAVSHELRTPLAAICSAADNLAAGVATEPLRAQQYGEAILSKGRQLTQMVEQILTFAGGHFGKRVYDLEVMAPAAAVTQAIAAVAPAARAAGVEIDERIPVDLPPVLGDAAAIQQALVNLLTNASKYAAAGRWIGVSVWNGSGVLEISVEDKGPGIPPRELSRIFEPFYRGSTSTASRTHGAGLGLTIVEQIAEAHSGRVTVVSAPGKGSCFTLHLPTV